MGDDPEVTPGGSHIERHVHRGAPVPLAGDERHELAADARRRQDERHYWPVRPLRTLARMPHEYGFALGPWHTVPNVDPAEPYGPGTEL